MFRSPGVPIGCCFPFVTTSHTIFPQTVYPVSNTFGGTVSFSWGCTHKTIPPASGVPSKRIWCLQLTFQPFDSSFDNFYPKSTVSYDMLVTFFQFLWMAQTALSQTPLPYNNSSFPVPSPPTVPLSAILLADGLVQYSVLRCPWWFRMLWLQI